MGVGNESCSDIFNCVYHVHYCRPRSLCYRRTKFLLRSARTDGGVHSFDTITSCDTKVVDTNIPAVIRQSRVF